MMKTFVSLKAFGDLAICLTNVERVPAAQRGAISLLYGSHLTALIEALSPRLACSVLEVGEGGVPSLFDLRRNGLVRAARSARILRRGLLEAFAGTSATAVLDTGGLRERYVTRGVETIVLPSAGNIYAAYQQFLADAGYAMNPVAAVGVGMRPTLGIFPGSRWPFKNLPLPLINMILDKARKADIPSTLVLLDGERPDLQTEGLHCRVIPRSFGALIDAIDGVDRVISADSLPAHLAERAGKPVFVLSPRLNPYWLPLTSLVHDRHALFADTDVADRLMRFMITSMSSEPPRVHAQTED